jgi:hypothetical protein
VGRLVVTYAPGDPHRDRTHESVPRSVIARMLAELLDGDFGGEYEPSRNYPEQIYFLPGETLVGIATARSLGIHTEDDLFGGVVPHPFVATKTITHPLIAPNAYAPTGWSHRFADRVRDVVLPGFAAFTPSDARCAGLRLLEQGPVRIKPGRGKGWRGQTVVATPAELYTALNGFDVSELSVHGVVLEQNLVGVTACSVGQVRVGGLLASYHGTQRETTDNRGATAYGGSDLLVVRGDYEDLLALRLPAEAQLAVTQARMYDAAMEEFPGLLASRRNYDVAQGTDAGSNWRSGVLEQSWRIGGASGAEVAALQAFRTDPSLRAVRASCVEVFGLTDSPPPDAIVHFHGVDAHVGPVIKYTQVEAYVSAR